MASGNGLGDPRAALVSPSEISGVRPVVGLPRPGLSALAMLALAAIAGLILFLFLDARRRATAAPATFSRAEQIQPGIVPPRLYLPPDTPPPAVAVYQVPAPVNTAPARPVEPRIIYVPQPQAAVEPRLPPPDLQQRPSANSPALVMDASAPPPVASGEAATAEAATAPAAVAVAGGGGRARSGMFANRATTVPQGTVIQAVLETALDSTRPGFARAIVSRDVRGFDGSRVLIPRGSRLIGEYRSEAAPGQRRALVNWVRLIRPDGVTIAIGSPAADPLGRGGIRARVDTHFFERFTGAILQSALDVGVALAGRSASNNSVVILPGAIQGATQVIQPAQITNTLTVRQGTSISIFAARDLDFTDTERPR